MSTRLVEYEVRVNTTGSAGSATGTALSDPIFGEIDYVAIDYTGAPVTTTVDLDEQGVATRKILDKAASNTDVVHYPSHKRQTNVGADIATDVYQRFLICGREILVTVALSDQLTPAVIVRIGVLEHQ